MGHSELAEASGLNDGAMPISCAVMIIGIAFLMKCREIPIQAFEMPHVRKVIDLNSAQFGVAAALCAHMLFVVGVLAWGLGLLCLGLALRLVPELAVFPTFLNLFVFLAYMKIFRQSPMGVPGITGPPLPAIIINVTVTMYLLINLIVNQEYLFDASKAEYDFKNFSAEGRFALCLVLAFFPQLAGFKHRRDPNWQISYPVERLASLPADTGDY
ncbi:unnamed protein product [Amoebophrya sp. A25]|nr:unnamed protein product [Amoebophrya sp. A25]|eukprot:GSA25T00004827001.1